MIDVPAKTSRAIATFSFLATILVVMCHTDDAIPAVSRTLPVRFFGGVFSDANVCNFFFLSGFLLARHFGEIGWWRKSLAGRIRTLAIPYILWCAVYFLLSRDFPQTCSAIISAFAAQGEGLAALAVHLAKTIRRVFGLGLLVSPKDFALWYIKTLFYFVAVSSIAFPVLLKSRKRFVAALAGILMFYLIGNGFRFPIMPYFGFCFHIFGFAAFLCGGYCAMNAIVSIPERMERAGVLLPLVLWTVVSALCFAASPFIGRLRGLLPPINIATSCFCLVWISFALNWSVPSALSKCGFFIYAAHLMILKFLVRIAPPHTPSTVLSTLYFCALLATAIAACTAIAHLVHQLSPRVAGWLSGGRFDRPTGKCSKDLKKTIKENQ